MLAGISPYKVMRRRKCITTKAQYMLIFGRRAEYLEKVRQEKQRILNKIMEEDEKRWKKIEEDILIEDRKRIILFNGQKYLDKQYNGSYL